MAKVLLYVAALYSQKVRGQIVWSGASIEFAKSMNGVDGICVNISQEEECVITLNVFFAYQFSNAQFSKIMRERTYSDALVAVNAELRELDAGFLLHWEY